MPNKCQTPCNTTLPTRPDCLITNHVEKKENSVIPAKAGIQQLLYRIRFIRFNVTCQQVQRFPPLAR